MSEVSLWDTLRGLLPRGQYSRIESGDTAPGFPDVHYQLPGDSRRDPRRDWKVAGSIELKHSRHRVGIPFRNEEEGLHLSQQIWIRENIANGGICWIAAQVGEVLFWVHGSRAIEFNECSLKELHLMSTHSVVLKKIYPIDIKNMNLMLRGMLR